MTYTKEQLGEKFGQLPENVQDAIIAVETADIVHDIGTKYALHIDQIGELADEIGLVMLGLTHPNDFVTHIIARLGLDRVIAEAMARDVNEQIFLKIRESLQALQPPAASSNDGVDPLPASTPPPATLPTDLPDRDKIIDDIEHPPISPSAPVKEDTVFEQKMGKLFRIPREEVDLDPYSEKPD